MKKSFLSARARTDLEEIWVYIAQDNPGSADRFVDRILQACRKLAQAPRIGRPRDELASGLRSLPFEKYVIFYRVAASGVEIVRILSGYRDIEVLFDR